MLVSDKQGNQLLELLKLPETDLSNLVPLTHALIVPTHGSKFLLVFNRYRQYWEVPGGMIDPGETPRVCVVRELFEETGIQCDLETLRFIGAMKFLLTPDKFHAETRIEYGALYTVTLADDTNSFVATDEISTTCWWDGSEQIGEIALIDEELTKLI